MEPLELVDELDQVTLARGPERTACPGLAWARRDSALRLSPHRGRPAVRRPPPRARHALRGLLLAPDRRGRGPRGDRALRRLPRRRGRVGDRGAGVLRRPGPLPDRAGRRGLLRRARRPRRARRCPASADALRVDLGPDARLELRIEGRVDWPRRGVRRDRAGAVRARAAAVLAPAPARRPRRGLAAGTAPRSTPRRTGARASPSTGGGARRRASRAPTPAWRSPAGACSAARPTAVVVRGRGPRAAAGAAVRAHGHRGRRRRLARARPLRRAGTSTVEGEAAGRAGGPPGPGPGERRVEPRSQQYLAGRLQATVRRGRRVWWSGESTLAGLERWL